MNALFSKLNLGSHDVITVLDAPASFEPDLKTLQGVLIRRTVSAPCAFAMAFVITQADLDAASRKLAAGCTGDAIVWMVYPKGTSKKYLCEFNRDCGWPQLAAAGFEPVRMVAIDADWSALRFRRVQFIKTMTRKKQ
jgi:hypothetical protein